MKYFGYLLTRNKYNLLPQVANVNEVEELEDKILQITRILDKLDPNRNKSPQPGILVQLQDDCCLSLFEQHLCPGLSQPYQLIKLFSECLAFLLREDRGAPQSSITRIHRMQIYYPGRP
jgi:hypothetical protein